MNYEIFIEMYRWFLNQLHFENHTIDVNDSAVTRYVRQAGALSINNYKTLCIPK